jgi:predicted DNA-binding transcriptional regulator AlpA
MRRLITATQVAELLGIGRRQFLMRRSRLQSDHGFPPAVAGLPDRWDPLAIDAWLASQRPAAPPAPDAAAEAEAVLIGRARSLSV